LNHPPELSDIVILDPRFLVKGILADLFSSNPTVQSMKKGGVVRHADLGQIWKRFKREGGNAEEFSSLCSSFITLLQTLGVCFVMEEDRSKPFMEQRSIIPAILPERDPSDHLVNTKFSLLWPSDPPPNKPVQIERVLKFENVVPGELVSRLLVHLHQHIQDGLLWKNEAVILVKSLEKSQAWIQVEEKERRFIVMLRGSEVGECTKLLDFILNQVGVFSNGDRGLRVEWKEKIRSPHYSGGVEIDVSEAMGEAGVEEVKRKLVCPETLLPIRAEKLLIRAGLSLPPPASSPKDGPIPPAWWNFYSSSVVEVDGLGKKSNHLVSVYDKTSPATGLNPVKNQELYDKFMRLFSEMNGEVVGIERVYGVNNPQLRSAFEFKREVIEKQHRYTPGLFRKEEWRSLGDAEQRKRMYHHLSTKIRAFRGEFNDGSHPFVVPMVHGTTENAAVRVMEGGFGTVAGLDDGHYGRGMYFTSDLRYANMYAEIQTRRHSLTSPSGSNVFLVAAVLPGNPYPVTEHPFIPKRDKDGKLLHPPKFEMEPTHEGKEKRKRNPLGLLGQACKGGYQSHYAVVDTKTISLPFPTQFDDFDDPKKNRIVSDELVVFEGAQALPLFLVYYKTPSLLDGVGIDLIALSPPPSPLSEGKGPPPFSLFSFDLHNLLFLRIDLSSDSAKLLEHLMSKEVKDVATQQPQSVTESGEVPRKEVEALRKELEDQARKIEEKERENGQLKKEIEEKDRHMEEQTRKIRQLEDRDRRTSGSEGKTKSRLGGSKNSKRPSLTAECDLSSSSPNLLSGSLDFGAKRKRKKRSGLNVSLSHARKQTHQSNADHRRALPFSPSSWPFPASARPSFSPLPRSAP